MSASVYDGARREIYSSVSSGGAASSKEEEDLSSQIDGATTTFIMHTITTSVISSTVELYYNGIKQRNPNEFSINSGNRVETTFTPSASSTLTVQFFQN